MSDSEVAPLRVGLCVPVFAHPGGSFFRTPNWLALDPPAAIGAVRLAEDLGYDSLWVADHLMHGRDDAILEGWTTLAFLAGQTSRLRLGTIHLAHRFRPPALTAKMAATLDVLSGGRLIFFYDVGSAVGESLAYGYPEQSFAESAARMDEGLQVIRALWTADGPVAFAGHYYRLAGAVCHPAPAQRPTPPIWLGEVRDDAWAGLVWKHATGWNSVPATLDGYRDKLTRLAAAAPPGRDLRDLELSLEIEVLVRPTRAAVREVAERIAAHPPAGPARVRQDLLAHLRGAGPGDYSLGANFEERALVGTPEEVAERIRQYQALGVRHLLLWFLDFPSTEGIEWFARAVRPQL